MHKIKLSATEADEFYNLEHIPIALEAIHPNYDDITTTHDFRAVKLKWASKLYANQVVALDSPTDGVDLKSGDDLVTFGFGTLTSGGTTPNIMQEVIIDYIINADCVNSYGYTSSEIDNSMICAGRAGKDSCQVMFSFLFLKLTLHLIIRVYTHACIFSIWQQQSRVTREVLFLTLPLRISLSESFLGDMDVLTLIILEVRVHCLADLSCSPRSQSLC